MHFDTVQIYVVNTDGDNQYPQDRIGDLVQPIIAGEADIVIGDRQTATIAEFSGFKKIMQRFGSWIVNKAAGTNVPDLLLAASSLFTFFFI